MKETGGALDLGKGKINKLMLKFSIPCILSLLISSLYNIVDQIFIGNSKLSALGNAATGVVFPIFIIAQAFAWCFGDGCAAYLNICQGKKEPEKAHIAVGGSITLSFLCGVLLLAVVYPFKESILTVFGASENTMAYAVEYLQKNLPIDNITLWVATIDEELTSHSYIVPGLGDAGDLAFGVKK